MALPTIDSLTPREREILALIAEGSSLPEIAQRLHRSLKTIESHRLSLGRKLKASNRVELARIAIAQGLVSVKNESLVGEENGTAKPPAQELGLLCDISAAVCNVTGKRYISELCNAFTAVLGVRYCAVCLPDLTASETDRFTVAMSEAGRPLEALHYKVDATPVPRVIEEGICLIEDGLSAQYPDEPFFQEKQLRSYLGIRLEGDFDGGGGVFTVLHDQPLEHTATIERIMRFFLARTAAELERIHRADECEQLRSQVRALAVKPESNSGAMQWSEEFDGLNQLLTHLTGFSLLSDLADALCVMFDAQFSGVCVKDTVDGQRMYLTLAFSERGRRIDPIHYQIADTPCEKVAQQGSFCAHQGVADQFPEDTWLRKMGIEAYYGVRLTGATGEKIGVMWISNDAPLADGKRAQDTLRYLTLRVGAEVEMLMELDKLREKYDSLEQKYAEQHTEQGKDKR